MEDTEISVLIISHEMNTIKDICDRFIAIHQGEMMVEDTPENVLSDDRVRTSYLGEMTR
jgi:lipopolysaccharide export system ATP-binding protein